MNKRLNQLLSLCLLLVLITLAGCASYVSVSATRFHEFTQEKTLVITSYQFSRSIQTGDDLEARQYARVISRELKVLGMNEQTTAPYRLEFTTSAPKSIIQTIEPITEPMFFCAGVGVNRYCGPRNLAIQGTRPITYEIFRNTLELSFVDTRTEKRIWQAKAEAATPGEAALLNVLPYLVRALMDSFPGESGKVIRINYPVMENHDSPKSSE